MGRPTWELFPHGADIGVCGLGSTLEEAFENGAVALTAVVCDPAKVEPLESVTIACDDSDRELLFVDWLNALIYEMATQRMLFSRFSVSFEGSRLTGEAWGEAVDVKRHAPAVEVKGATLTCLSVIRMEDGTWRAQCVVDV